MINIFSILNLLAIIFVGYQYNKTTKLLERKNILLRRRIDNTQRNIVRYINDKRVLVELVCIQCQGTINREVSVYLDIIDDFCEPHKINTGITLRNFSLKEDVAKFVEKDIVKLEIHDKKKYFKINLQNDSAVDITDLWRGKSDAKKEKQS